MRLTERALIPPTHNSGSRHGSNVEVTCSYRRPPCCVCSGDCGASCLHGSAGSGLTLLPDQLLAMWARSSLPPPRCSVNCHPERTKRDTTVFYTSQWILRFSHHTRVVISLYKMLRYSSRFKPQNTFYECKTQRISDHEIKVRTISRETMW